MSEKRKPGRPRKESEVLTPANFRKLCQMQCTLEEISDFFDVSEDTIQRRCQEWFMTNFAVSYKRYSAGGRQSIRRAQYDIALGGSIPMLIWLGKQYLGQRETPETTSDDANIPAPVYSIKGKKKETA